MKTTIEQVVPPTPKPQFLRGKLYILNTDGSDPYVVLATVDAARDSRHFAGTIVHTGGESHECMGAHHPDFLQSAFSPFVGVLTVDTTK